MSTRDDRERLELLQGTLDLLILRTLIFGSEHGQGIARAIQQTSGEELLVEHGALYPALRRLEERGWISAKWGTSSNNRRRASTPCRRWVAGNSGKRPRSGSGSRRRSGASSIRERARSARREARCSAAGVHPDDFAAEVDSHIKLEMDRLRDEGLSEEDARAAARRTFGNVIVARERFYESQSLAVVGPSPQDVRYATRMLRRAPGFTSITVLTMVIGIGATTAIFSGDDATLLRPLPYVEPDQLVSVVDDLPGAGAYDVGLSQPEWVDLERSGIFQYVSPQWFDENNLTGAARPSVRRRPSRRISSRCSG